MAEQEPALLEELRTVTALLKVISCSAIKQLLAAELDSDKARRVYRASDGSATQAEIAKGAGVKPSDRLKAVAAVEDARHRG